MFLLVGSVQLQVRQNGQQVAVPAEQVLLVKNKTVQNGCASHGKYIMCCCITSIIIISVAN